MWIPSIEMLAALLVAWLLPAGIGYGRRHAYQSEIAALTIVTGAVAIFTFRDQAWIPVLAWAVLLAWACWPSKARGSDPVARPSGGVTVTLTEEQAARLGLNAETGEEEGAAARTRTEG